MTSAEENFHLLERIDADRRFLLLAMQSNPALLAHAEARVREWFVAVPPAPTLRNEPAPGGTFPLSASADFAK